MKKRVIIALCVLTAGFILVVLFTRGGVNGQPQDFYGRVIDQYGQPVVTADVAGNIAWIRGFDIPEKKQTIQTYTDAKGEFQFTGIRAWELGVMPGKAGYELARNTDSLKLPPGGKTSPENRGVFTMWKLRGAEPMVYRKIRTGLACDGSPLTLDLLAGHKVASGGDLTVKLIRTPLNIDRTKAFDWSLSLEVPTGGLMTIEDVYPNEAPAEGYQPIIIKQGHAGPPRFTDNEFDQSFYVKSRNGQVYGRVDLHITTDYETPPTVFQIDAYTNPGGSRNLEFDPNLKAQAQ